MLIYMYVLVYNSCRMAAGQGTQKGSAHSLFGLVRDGIERLRSGSSQGSTDTEDGIRRAPEGDEIQQLHAPKNSTVLRGTLKKGESLNVDAIEPSLEKAPIHSILTNESDERHNLLQTLLTYSDADVNLPDLDGMTPLHLAVKSNDIHSTKMLIAFGANLNALNNDGKTPLDISKSLSTQFYFRNFNRQPSLKSWTGITVDEGDEEYGFMVVSLPGNGDTGVIEKFDRPHPAITQVPPPAEVETDHPPPGPASLEDSVFANNTSPPSSLVQSTEEQIQSLEEIESEMTQLLRSVGSKVHEEVQFEQKLSEKKAGVGLEKDCRASIFELPGVVGSSTYEDGSESRRIYKLLDDTMKEQSQETRSIGDFDEILCSSKQRSELAKYKKTGSRILCLDGGGMKGLVEIDVMENIEKKTGKKITELFDWIVGTSTGGILALGLVYAKKSLKELRQLCFRLKNDVFASPKFGITYNTEALEELLISSLGTEMRMSDVTHPKVLVAATHKETIPLQIHLFNNCFDNELSNEVVWKVARSTCAGPMLFSEYNNYVDGGVLCNNPTDQGMTAIQNYHWEKGEKLPISLVVSVGTGVYPQEKLGSVNAQDCFTLTKVINLKVRVENLIDLFTNALVESEIVADTCERNFHEQGIPFYRFSPQLLEFISAGETDSTKLLDMIITTRKQTKERVHELAITHLCFEGATSS